MEQHKPEEVFCEGRNEEEALQAACDRLSTTPNQVEHEVVESGASGGVLGFLKGRTVRIRVWKKPEGQRKLTDLVKGLCDTLDMGLTFQVAQGEDGYEVSFETDGSDGLLIGRGGETLAALQHLLSRMAAHGDETLRVHVDVAGYRRRRQDKLRRNARELADRCLGSGREVVSEPLPADERRVVHLALAEDPRVRTRAIGEGLTKRVVVVPSSGATGATSGAAETPSAGLHSRGRGHDRERGPSRGGGPRMPRRPGPVSRSETRTPADRLRTSTRAIEERQHEDRPERPERPERVDRPDRPQREERSERPERLERPERPPRPMPPPEPARMRPAPEEPAAAPRANEEPREDSYFRIPERVGLVTPAPEKSEPGGEAENSEPKPVTFGRRPRAGQRRGR